MQTDVIEAVGIEGDMVLWVKPATATFPHIYLEAMEVHWDAERLRLYSPDRRDWSHVQWFRQIRNAAREQGVNLTLGPTTVWLDVDVDTQQSIMAVDN